MSRTKQLLFEALVKSSKESLITRDKRIPRAIGAVLKQFWRSRKTVHAVTAIIKDPEKASRMNLDELISDPPDPRKQSLADAKKDGQPQAKSMKVWEGPRTLAKKKAEREDQEGGNVAEIDRDIPLKPKPTKKKEPEPIQAGADPEDLSIEQLARMTPQGVIDVFGTRKKIVEYGKRIGLDLDYSPKVDQMDFLLEFTQALRDVASAIEKIDEEE